MEEDPRPPQPDLTPEPPPPVAPPPFVPPAGEFFATDAAQAAGIRYEPFQPELLPVTPVALPPPVPVPNVWPRVLAGLESGILGATCMVAWFALEAQFENQYWWAMLNLWGAGVYQSRVLTMGFGIATLSGAAMHVFLHGAGGAAWGLLGGRITNGWWHLVCSFCVAAGWYLFLMQWFWPVVAPVVSRVSPVPATPLAYLLFGAAISRNFRRSRQLDAAFAEPPPIFPQLDRV